MNSSCDTQKIQVIIALLGTATKGMTPPAVDLIIQKYGKDPFLILISCVLSLRTTDPISYAASVRLFAHAATPEALMHMDPEIVARAIFPVNFYRRKTGAILRIATILSTQYNNKVPSTIDQLLLLPGVGRKTATLVCGYAYDIPAICVDTHVHRVTNRLGWVNTKTPEQTEQALTQIVPQAYWIELNRLFVMWGQNICRPQSPKCSQCPLALLCPQRGVTIHR